MANKILIKKSTTSSQSPSSLDSGELAINLADGKLFYKNPSNTIIGSKLISNIVGTINQVTVSESSGTFTISLPSNVSTTTGTFTSLFVDSIEIDTTGAQTNNILKYNGTKFAPSADAGQVSVSDTAPSSPVSGDLWYNSGNGRSFVYYDSFWVEMQ